METENTYCCSECEDGVVIQKTENLYECTVCNTQFITGADDSLVQQRLTGMNSRKTLMVMRVMSPQNHAGPMPIYHMDPAVNQKLVELLEAVTEWERASGRGSRVHDILANAAAQIMALRS